MYMFNITHLHTTYFKMCFPKLVFDHFLGGVCEGFFETQMGKFHQGCSLVSALRIAMIPLLEAAAATRQARLRWQRLKQPRPLQLGATGMEVVK